MSRAILLVLILAMLSGCITLPRDVASELEPVAHQQQDHFHKP
jgi:starvation-inducible outer membrane lipoprotein